MAGKVNLDPSLFLWCCRKEGRNLGCSLLVDGHINVDSYESVSEG